MWRRCSDDGGEESGKRFDLSTEVTSGKFLSISRKGNRAHEKAKTASKDGR